MIVGTSRPGRGIEAACVGVSVVFCMVGSATAMMAVKDWLDDWMGDAAGPVGLAVLIGGWIVGGPLLGRALVRQWDAGWKRRTVLVLLTMVAAVPVLVTVVIPNVRGRWERFGTVFGPHAAEYMARTPTEPRAGRNRVRGRCVVVSDKGVDALLMSDLPRRLRAESPDEVRSVVQLRWGRENLTTPPGAWVGTCRITILDAATGEHLADHTLRGTWREVKPKNKPKYWSGDLGTSEVHAYLRELPQERE